jgi:hypothetical protein
MTVQRVDFDSGFPQRNMMRQLSPMSLGSKFALLVLIVYSSALSSANSHRQRIRAEF